MAKDRNSEPAAPDIPALEWAAAGLGLLVTLAMLAAMAWQALGGVGQVPPAVEARVERVAETSAGYAVTLRLSNRSPTTAAKVQIEGELVAAGGTSETSGATIDYVPGRSERRAGLFFRQDPRRHRLEVRVLGYSEP